MSDQEQDREQRLNQALIKARECPHCGELQRQLAHERAAGLAAQAKVQKLEHDIQAYRAALGYSVPGNHSGKLTDGTTPQCGLCNSEHRKNLEAECERLREELQAVMHQAAREVVEATAWKRNSQPANLAEEFHCVRCGKLTPWAEEWAVEVIGNFTVRPLRHLCPVCYDLERF